MPFFGRENELETLSQLLFKQEYPNALIYGRRRVGKSEIIHQFIERQNVISVYYQCINTSEADNVASLSKLVCETLKEEVIPFADFESIFSHLRHQAQDKAIILVLDEYSYWRNVQSGFDSVVQKCLDSSRNSNLKVILCGSQLSVMENLDAAKAPLFGRFCIKMKVLPFDYYDAAKFTEGLPLEEQVKYYCCFGGLPFLLSFIDKEKSFKENIIRAYLGNYAFISSFLETTIREEISKVEYANAIILSIAKGYHKYSDILSQSHIPTNVQLDRAMEILLDLNIVRKEAPINDENSRRKAYYSLKDNAFAFYFRYIFPNQSYLNVLSPSMFFDTFIQPFLEEQYISHRFEKICAEYLIRINKTGKLIPPFFKIGKYYYDLPKERKNGEFDIVTLSSEGYRSYEVKYRKEKVSEAMIEEERKSLADIPLADSIKLGFFSRSGYEKSHKSEDGFYTLEDLYK